MKKQDQETYQDTIGTRINLAAQIAPTIATMPADIESLAYPSNRPGIQTFTQSGKGMPIVVFDRK